MSEWDYLRVPERRKIYDGKMRTFRCPVDDRHLKPSAIDGSRLQRLFSKLGVNAGQVNKK